MPSDSSAPRPSSIPIWLMAPLVDIKPRQKPASDNMSAEVKIDANTSDTVLLTHSFLSYKRRFS